MIEKLIPKIPLWIWNILSKISKQSYLNYEIKEEFIRYEGITYGREWHSKYITSNNTPLKNAIFISPKYYEVPEENDRDKIINFVCKVIKNDGCRLKKYLPRDVKNTVDRIPTTDQGGNHTIFTLIIVFKDLYDRPYIFMNGFIPLKNKEYEKVYKLAIDKIKRGHHVFYID